MVRQFFYVYSKQDFCSRFSNRSIVIAADDSLVSWGPSPTYGELVCASDVVFGVIYMLRNSKI